MRQGIFTPALSFLNNIYFPHIWVYTSWSNGEGSGEWTYRSLVRILVRADFFLFFFIVNFLGLDTLLHLLTLVIRKYRYHIITLSRHTEECTCFCDTVKMLKIRSRLLQYFQTLIHIIFSNQVITTFGIKFKLLL